MLYFVCHWTHDSIINESEASLVAYVLGLVVQLLIFANLQQLSVDKSMLIALAIS